MLKRKAYQDMLFWKKHKTKQGLLVAGARQVGKTFLIREFARKEYEIYAELNLIEHTTAKKILSEATDSADLFLRITTLMDVELIPGKTLIFIDEVQESKELVTAIKFLVDNYDYDFVLSGSLLGVELKNIRSIPVGYLDTIEMYPLDFEEFCWANGVGEELLSHIEKAFCDKAPIPDFLHDKMMKLFHEYLIVGGMPAAVSGFVESNNIQIVRKIQSTIIHQHKQDVSKYNSDEALTIKRIYDLIPSELDKQNKRFIIGNVEGKARFNYYQNNFLWLVDAGVALPAYAVTSPTYPLKLSLTPNLFKFFMLDVGLLTSTFLKDTSLQILNRNDAINYGSIYENVVAQELYAHGFELYYYNNKKFGELDFVIERADGTILPIEVKSGKTYKRHKALSNVLDAKNYALPQGYVFCNSNIKQIGKILYLPIYLVSQFFADKN